MTQDYADVAQAVREDDEARGARIRAGILATARRQWPHAKRIELTPEGRLRVDLPIVIDVVEITGTVIV